MEIFERRHTKEHLCFYFVQYSSSQNGLQLHISAEALHTWSDSTPLVSCRSISRLQSMLVAVKQSPRSTMSTFKTCNISGHCFKLCFAHTVTGVKRNWGNWTWARSASCFSWQRFQDLGDVRFLGSFSWTLESLNCVGCTGTFSKRMKSAYLGNRRPLSPWGILGVVWAPSKG